MPSQWLSVFKSEGNLLFSIIGRHNKVLKRIPGTVVFVLESEFNVKLFILKPHERNYF